MGIQDRDYMKRRRGDDDDGRRYMEAESKIARWLTAFFEKYPRFGVCLGIVLLLLILAALIIARLSHHKLPCLPLDRLRILE